MIRLSVTVALTEVIVTDGEDEVTVTVVDAVDPGPEMLN